MTVDALLEISAGNVASRDTIEKYGRSLNVDNGVDTDIWDHGVAGTIWISPTAARKHEIYSSNAGDTVAGSGAKTIKIYGLSDWNTNEISETVTLSGTTHVTTVNPYVIIHRIRVQTKGGSPPNIGRLSAVAQTDGSTTAIILSGEGQTHMAIYGVPSTQKLFMSRVYANLIAAKTGSEIKIKLLVNPEPDAELLGFISKHTMGLMAAGNSNVEHVWNTYKEIDGPAIIKIQANGDTNNMDLDAGFEAVLINN